MKRINRQIIVIICVAIAMVLVVFGWLAWASETEPVSRSLAVENIELSHWSEDVMTILCDDPDVSGSPLVLMSTEPITLQMYIDFRIQQNTNISEMSYPLGAAPTECNGIYKQFVFGWQAHDDMSFEGVVSEEVRLRFRPEPITAAIMISSTGQYWNYETQPFFLDVVEASGWTVRRNFVWGGPADPGEPIYLEVPLIVR
jgi:hypothetical protein